MIEKTRKDNNPFKIWESYIGAILFFIIALFIDDIIIEFMGLCTIKSCINIDKKIYLIIWIFMTILGFLFGWSRHKSKK